MRIVIEDADLPNWNISIFNCDNPDDLNIVSLVAQTLDFNFTYIQRHHGNATGTITDLVEHINDGI